MRNYLVDQLSCLIYKSHFQTTNIIVEQQNNVNPHTKKTDNQTITSEEQTQGFIDLEIQNKC